MPYLRSSALLLLISPLASAALLTSPHYATPTPLAPACTTPTAVSALRSHQAARVPAVSMGEAIAVPAASTSPDLAPAKLLVRWLARAAIFIAIAMTPMLHLHATSMAIALPAPMVAMPTAMARVMQAVAMAARARLAALAALFAAVPLPTLGGASLMSHLSAVSMPT